MTTTNPFRWLAPLPNRLPGGRSTAAGLGCLLLALLLPLRSQAQINAGTTFNPVGSGARAMGQGNAFIAVADDATAASWNPAGLTQLERPECSLAGEYWQSHGQVLTPTEYRSEHDSSFADLNYASLVYPFRLADHNLTASLNYLKMFDLSQTLHTPEQDGFLAPPKWTADYRLRQEGAFAVVTPALAMDLTDHLAAGLAFNIWNDDITQNSSYRKRWILIDSQTGNMLDESYAIQRGYSFVLGTLYRPVKEWAFAGVVKPPFTLQGQRRRQYSYYEDNDPTWTFSPPYTNSTTINMPLVLGGGVAWRPSDPLTVALDLTWTEWSQFTMRQVGRRYNPISNDYLSRGRCQDAYAVRLGTEYVVPCGSCQIPLRCGVGYDPEPGIEEIVNYYTANVGTGIQWARYALDAAYEARWGNDVHTAALYWKIPPGTEDILQHRILLSMIVYFD
jgi:long-subunit fatty acid transport protein